MISAPFGIYEEEPQFRRAPAPVRVDKMIEMLKSKLPSPPQFLLCVLPERKNCDIYGMWLCLVEFSFHFGIYEQLMKSSHD